MEAENFRKFLINKLLKSVVIIQNQNITELLIKFCTPLIFQCADDVSLFWDEISFVLT